MNKRIRQQIELFKKIAEASKGHEQPQSTVKAKPKQPDSLSKFIRTKKEAAEFMSSLNAAIELAQRTQ